MSIISIVSPLDSHEISIFFQPHVQSIFKPSTRRYGVSEPIFLTPRNSDLEQEGQFALADNIVELLQSTDDT